MWMRRLWLSDWHVWAATKRRSLAREALFPSFHQRSAAHGLQTERYVSQEGVEKAKRPTVGGRMRIPLFSISTPLKALRVVSHNYAGNIRLEA